MKDEVKVKTSQFVGLQSKIYCLVILNNEESKNQKESIKMLFKT